MGATEGQPPGTGKGQGGRASEPRLPAQSACHEAQQQDFPARPPAQPMSAQGLALARMCAAYQRQQRPHLPSGTLLSS